MRICFISVEIFAWGKYGGFGRATRLIGRELAKRGIEVFAVVPRQKNQKPIEYLDGITVFSFPKYLPWTSRKLLKKTNADIFHSEEPSLGTYLALKDMPKSKHLITFRDPRNFDDWKMEFDLPSLNKIQVLSNYLYENNFLVKKAIRRIDNLFCTSNFLISKVKNMYSLDKNPSFLPTPVAIKRNIKKSSKPTVCLLARLDRRKRPEIFFNLAKKFPEVNFITMGKSRDNSWNNFLQKKYSQIPNLEIKGFIDQFSSDKHSIILERSWIMVNTATRESLPNSFLEAAAHKCAILSAVNPDGFASKFGYHVKDNDFAKGFDFLLSEQKWQEKGQQGYKYVKNNFELNLAIDKHINLYNEILKSNNSRLNNKALI